MSRSSMDNLKAFEDRIKRIEGAGGRKSKRLGHKSSGEYFRKEEDRRKRRRKGRKANWTGRILLVLIAFAGVKTYIMGSMGAEAYAARMDELKSGDRYHKAAFAVMQPDPVTLKLQEVLDNYGVFAPKPAERAVASMPVQDPTETPATGAGATPETQEAGSMDGEPASGSSAVSGKSN